MVVLVFQTITVSTNADNMETNSYDLFWEHAIALHIRLLAKTTLLRGPFLPKLGNDQVMKLTRVPKHILAATQRPCSHRLLRALAR